MTLRMVRSPAHSYLGCCVSVCIELGCLQSDLHGVYDDVVEFVSVGLGWCAERIHQVDGVEVADAVVVQDSLYREGRQQIRIDVVQDLLEDQAVLEELQTDGCDGWVLRRLGLQDTDDSLLHLLLLADLVRNDHGDGAVNAREEYEAVGVEIRRFDPTHLLGLLRPPCQLFLLLDVDGKKQIVPSARLLDLGEVEGMADAEEAEEWLLVGDLDAVPSAWSLARLGVDVVAAD